MAGQARRVAPGVRNRPVRVARRRDAATGGRRRGTPTDARRGGSATARRRPCCPTGGRPRARRSPGADRRSHDRRSGCRTPSGTGAGRHDPTNRNGHTAADHHHPTNPNGHTAAAHHHPTNRNGHTAAAHHHPTNPNGHTAAEHRHDPTNPNGHTAAAHHDPMNPNGHTAAAHHYPMNRDGQSDAGLHDPRNPTGRNGPRAAARRGDPRQGLDGRRAGHAGSLPGARSDRATGAAPSSQSTNVASSCGRRPMTGTIRSGEYEPWMTLCFRPGRGRHTRAGRIGASAGRATPRWDESVGGIRADFAPGGRPRAAATPTSE